MIEISSLFLSEIVAKRNCLGLMLVEDMFEYLSVLSV